MPSSLGPMEIMVILVVALIVLGPSKLPQAGRQVGRALAEIRRWTQEMKNEVSTALDTEAPSPQAQAPQAQAPQPQVMPPVIGESGAAVQPGSIVPPTSIVAPHPQPEDAATAPTATEPAPSSSPSVSPAEPEAPQAL